MDKDKLEKLEKLKTKLVKYITKIKTLQTLVDDMVTESGELFIEIDDLLDGE